MNPIGKVFLLTVNLDQGMQYCISAGDSVNSVTSFEVKHCQSVSMSEELLDEPDWPK